jgi:hypothetical protein
METHSLFAPTDPLKENATLDLSVSLCGPTDLPAGQPVPVLLQGKAKDLYRAVFDRLSAFFL